jgi:hypothetical protein
LEELEELKGRLESQRPAEWESLPDLSLYMDQVIGYMPRQLIQYEEGEHLTSAMVNNYIKDGLLPRAEGKRYGKAHLAYLTAICALKQVLPVRDAGLLVNCQDKGDSREMYERFRAELDRALGDTAERLNTGCEQEDLPQLALQLALRSYADKLACQRVLELIRQQQEPQEEKHKGKKKKG